MGERRQNLIRTALEIIRYTNIEPATVKELSEQTNNDQAYVYTVVRDMVELGLLRSIGLKGESHKRATAYAYTKQYYKR